MGKEESLASYHFWKHQYVCRHEEYRRYDEIRLECRQIFIEEGDEDGDLWNSLLETPDVDEFLNQKGIHLSVLARQMINKARDIELVVVDRFSLISAYREESSHLIELAISGELDDYVQNQALHFPSIGEFVRPFMNFDADTPFLDVRINSLGDIEVILEEVRSLYEIKRQQLSERLCREDLYEEYGDLHSPDVLMDSLKENNPSIPSQSYTHKPRVLGLWLWDYVLKNRCTQKEAKAVLQDKFNYCSLNIYKIDAADLGHYFRRTRACIEKSLVLSFDKKKKKGTKLAKPVP